jgi:hypothetical protein
MSYRNKVLHPWAQECSGNAIARTYGMTADSLSDQQWWQLTRAQYHHLLRFIEVTSPSRIVFGGGVAIAGIPYFQSIFDRIHATHPALAELPIEFSALGTHACLVGTFALLNHRLAQAEPPAPSS